MPSLLECAAYNISRQQQDLSMFEISAVYLADELPLTSCRQKNGGWDSCCMGTGC